MIILWGLIGIACSEDGSSDGDRPTGDSSHPGWLIGTWTYTDNETSSGSSRDFTYHFNADGSYSKDEYFCTSVGGCDLRTDISTGQWTGSDTTVMIGGQAYTHKATPNCLMIALDGYLYLKNEDVAACPFDPPPLSAAERCMLGDFTHSAHNYTHTYTFEENRFYKLRRFVDGYVQADSTTSTYGYWVVENGYLVLSSPIMEEDSREALLLDADNDSARLGESTYQHRVEDARCDAAALREQCECDSNTAASCMGDSMLAACTDGCHRELVSCAELCEEAGYESPLDCRYSSEYEQDTCFCDTGCDCSAGDNQCNGSDLDYCRDGCSWSQLDCDELCQEAGYDYSTSCGWDDETDENVCWCESN
jgi:hypothetical protein